ncbi:MAG TPA: sigma-54-dependent Fis family transcriptional regulator [Desulfobacteraceae bacterium]|nr:sigma-54-dependent Fis family transcriptional regulator [Desulfobacteraceae bacterium]
MSKKERILVVDDDSGTRKALRRILGKNGFEVRTAESGKAALDILGKNQFSLVLTDLLMEPVDGFEVLSKTKKLDPDTEVIIMTGYGSISSAVEAIKKQAFHYIEKPLRSEEVRHLISQALEKRCLRLEVQNLKKQIQSGFEKIIGKSPKLLEIKRLIRQIATSDSNVLITGESGTGKELVAHAIHNLSRRSAKKFLPINCASFTDELLANELFGHEKDAYTGATSSRAGLLESADGGTIFFDEVGDMSMAMQSKLLRVIQERKLIRVGGFKPIGIDIRIVAATNKDLKKAMKAGSFREDLFYRLNVIPIHIPSLSERKEDILLLAQYFLDRFNTKSKRKISGFSKEAAEILKSYDYPGNVRELENIVERSVSLAKAELIDADDLPDDLREIELFTVKREKPYLKSIQEIENEYIEWVLEQCNHNKSQAAKILKIDRASLYRKLKRTQIKDC